jgi:hypothetical protein
MRQTPIWKTRTFYTGVAGIIVAAGSYVAGDIGTGALLQTVTTALLGIFIRDGISRETLRH